jgi:hypothetical protein
MNIFSVNSDTQDVELLLDSVGEALRQWEAGDTPPLDLSIMLGDAGKLSQRAARLKGQWNLNSWAIIQSTRTGLGPWIIRFQHLVRKLTWWYTEPLLDQIRGFQRNTALTVDGLAQSHEELLQMVQRQALQLEALEKQVAELQRENTEASQ